jgi:phage shock protein C
MARTYGYSLNRHDKKVAGVASTLGEIFNIDPTFIRIGFVAIAILVSWKLALIGYVGTGIYLAVKRKRANEGIDRRSMTDFERMEYSGRARPSVHALRNDLDETDRRLMAIDDHINSHNDELAREIEALREDK